MSWSPQLSSSFLTALGADETVVAACRSLPRPGRVVRAERGAVLVATPAGDVPRVGAGDPPPTVGDWVGLDGDRVAVVLPRRTEVIRADAAGRSVGHVLAANVDVLLVCTPLEPGPPLARLERLLAVAWGSGATPVVVATKADACPPAARPEALAALRTAAPGVDVVPVSVRDGSAATLSAYAGPGRTLALLGVSGVGKSSLANALLGGDRLPTAEIRSDGKGRHTTTWRELVVLPGGGALIDTPGLRGVGLAGTDGLARAFADVEDLAVDCRFSDCRHAGEPGCAVTAAVEAGVLDVRRVERAGKLQRERAWQAAKTDARLRAERTRHWKAISRANRSREPRPR